MRELDEKIRTTREIAPIVGAELATLMRIPKQQPQTIVRCGGSRVVKRGECKRQSPQRGCRSIVAVLTSEAACRVSGLTVSVFGQIVACIALCFPLLPRSLSRPDR